MRRLIAAALAAAPCAVAAATIIENVRGYTPLAAGEGKRFEALAMDDAGRVLWAGTVEEARAKAPGAKRIDAGGRALLPGLIDAHGHVLGLGHAINSLDLRLLPTLEATLAKIEAHAKKHPSHAWILGRGWNQVPWKINRFPTAAELDRAVADRPAFLRRVDGHAAWANSRALHLAGVTRDTPDPPGGRIERDAEGRPSGVLIDAAMQLVSRVVPHAPPQEARDALDAALARLRELGITGVHDMGMGASTDALYREYAAAGKLTARIHGAYESVGASFDRLPDKGPAIRYGGDAYVLGSVKLFADGALGSRGAALRTPYTDKPDSTGLLFQQEAAIAGDMEKAMARGYQVAVHAIGDAANRQVLDAFEKLAAKYPVRTSRHRIEHAQVIALDDIERFAKLGVIASVQPTHATSDMNMAEARVGPERIRGAYAWRKLLASGARLACGSDFPVESANPFLGLHAAVTRESPGGVPAGGWYPAEKMTLAEALRCFTLDAAYAGRSEERQGSLEPGKWADFVVLDRDPFAVAPRELADLKVLETWLGGRRVR